jgi:ectoine hydroxylase-related dioxygenase (phytanoyl-CoA dioxygenase family)
VPIVVQKDANSLLVEPDSHKRTDLEWSSVKKGNTSKPTLKTPNDKVHMTMPDIPLGFSIWFNDDLLHGGSLNLSNYCRVSFEFTIIASRAINE